MRRLTLALLLTGCTGVNAMLTQPDLDPPSPDMARASDLARVRVPQPDLADPPDLTPACKQAGDPCAVPSQPSPECCQVFTLPTCNQAVQQYASCTNAPTGPIRQVCLQWIKLASGGSCYNDGSGWQCTDC